MNLRFESRQWALILGGSSGFGLATAQKLARHGMSVAIVHRDRKGALEEIVGAAESSGVGARGLTSLLEDILHDVMFDAPDIDPGELRITRDYVKKRLP